MEGSEVSVLSSSKNFVRLEQSLLASSKFFLRKLRKKNVSLSVFLVNDGEISKLNRAYRGKNLPTNVLAFEHPKNFPREKRGIKNLGEVYLAPRYIEKHGEDIFYMLLHGILHLLGFNHENKSDRMSMEKIEGALVKQWRNSKS